MTETEAKQKLITFLQAQVGYRESGVNCTKYASDYDYDSRLYGFDMNGLAWCDYFTDFAFIVTFGFEKALKMTYQFEGCQGAACRWSATYYKNHGAFYQYPEVGDQIFFYYDGDINHTGIVIGIEGNTVITVEGNSSDSVRRNSYSINNSIIAGYGRPDWSVVTGDSTPENPQVENSEKQSCNIAAGDIVSIADDACYYSGVAIPEWVKNDRWIVLSVYNDRAVINQNEARTRAIMSPINVKYLRTDGSVYEEEEPKEHASDVPAPDIYTVKTGDSLWAIAQRYLGSGLRYKEIKALNGLRSDVIHPGQNLKLP